ncbi:MAG: DMT family transporter [Beijerinckiaceae bacterium]
MSTQSQGDVSHSFVVMHLAACSFLWGNSFLFMKLIGDGLNPLVIASLRATGAFLVLAVVVALLGQSVLPKGREWKDWAALGTLNGWIPNTLVAFSLQSMDSGPAALIQSSGPLMTAVLAHFLLAGEKLNVQKVTAVMIGLVGVGLLIGPQALSGTGTILAIAGMLMVALGYSLGNIYTRRIPTAEPLRLALGQQMFSTIFAGALGMSLFGFTGYAPASSHIWPLVMLSVFSTAIPIWIFMRLIRYGGPTRAAMTGYLVPAVAVATGMIVLQEPVLLRQIIGGAVVLIAVGIVTGALQWPVRRAA